MSRSSGVAAPLAVVPGILLVAAMATFAESFRILRLSLLMLFVLASAIDILRGKTLLIHSSLVSFYLWMCVAAITWALVGLMHSSNYVLGVFDALRLYVIWSFVFLLLFSLFRSVMTFKNIHVAFVASGILISLINFVGLTDQIANWGLIPAGILEALELRVGIHDGYIQITSRNIGPLFFIVPYLIALQFRADAKGTNSAFTKLSLLLSVLLVAVSGRRALWLVVALTPCAILLLAYLTNSRDLIRSRARGFLAAYSVAVVLVLGASSVLVPRLQEVGYVRHFTDAFLLEDERSIQKHFLLDAFKESPLIGSGFGAYGGYVRSEERPWTYELTYLQMLFNLGFVGTVAVGGCFAIYVRSVIRLLKRFRDQSAIPFGLLVGVGALLFGAISNPYLSSFDFMFLVGLLPYLSTFRRGFNELTARFRVHSAFELRLSEDFNAWTARKDL